MKSLGSQKFTVASDSIAKIRTEFHGFLVSSTVFLRNGRFLKKSKLFKVEVVSAYKLISRLWREEEKCGFSEIPLFKLPILALGVVKKSGYKDIFKQKSVDTPMG